MRALREAAGMTQAQLGAKMGVTTMTILRWESDKYDTKPPKRVRFKLAHALGVSVDELGY